MKKWKKRLFITAISITGLLAIALVGIVTYANFYVNDEDVKVSTELFPKNSPKRILAIFAHPDDEIMVAGTFHKLSEDEDVVSVLATFTRGEAGPTGGLVSQDLLGKERTKELTNISEILDTDHLEIFDYPDGGLTNTDPNKIKDSIRQLIDTYQPTTILTYDDVLGLYGHPDHLLMGKLTKEVVLEEVSKGGSSIKRLYMATLPKPMIDLALKLSPTFQENYPAEGGLPEPSIAFPMASEAKVKKQVLLAHKTQWEVVGSVQPYYDKIPSQIYYRIFDREYYHLVDIDN